MKKKALIIDHYDSFTYNLVQQIENLGTSVEVVYHDQIDLDTLSKIDCTHIVLSPGPGHVENPSDFQVSRSLIESYKQQRFSQPLLGVCLGHQGIAHVYGAKITKAPKIMHGKMSDLFYEKHHLFEGIDQPMQVMRYHSWVVDPLSLASVLKPIAFAQDDQSLMAFAHQDLHIYGVQFHPESVGSPLGHRLISNFLKC
jgi:anthranilate synthase component 2